MVYALLRFLKLFLFVLGLVLVGYGESRLLLSEDFIHDLEKVKSEIGVAFELMVTGLVSVIISIFFKRR